MYGNDSGERAPRRRRRRPDDTTDTGAHTIIERVNSESAKLQPIRDDTPPPSRTSHRQQRPASHHKPEPAPRPAPPPRPAPARQPAPEPPQVDSQSLPPQFREPSRPAMRPVQQPPSRTDLPRLDQRSAPPRPAPQPQPQPQSQPLPRPPQPPPGMVNPEPTRPVPPPQPRRRATPPPQAMPSGTFPAPPPVDAEDLRPTTAIPAIGNALAPEEMTEQLPRVGQPPGQHPAPFPPARANFGPTQAPPERNGMAQTEVRYPSEYDDLVDEDERPRDDYPGYRGSDDPDDLDDLEVEEFADEDAEDSPSPGREWLVMAGQVAISVVGGAGVWLGFNWLWGKLPQAALVAALAVIVGLVWIVRKIRRADDLQTTGLAVLVGLFVTVSPAALLLLSR
jgi:hypothetical protein